MNPGGRICHRWNQMCYAAMMISLFIDPLFFFSPRVQPDRFCVENEAYLDATLVVLRSINDIFYWLHILLQFRTAYVSPSSRVFGSGDLVVDPNNIVLRYLRKSFWMDLLAALPLPQYGILPVILTMLKFQILVLTVIPNADESLIWDRKIVYRFIIIIQCCFRLYHLCLLSLQAVNETGVVSETIWWRAAHDLLLFFVASHISGACWYLFAIERQEECWRSVCNQQRLQTCGYELFDCRMTDHLNRTVWFASSNVTAVCDPTNNNYQFGIYALGATTGASSLPFPYRYSYSLWIALQAITSTGQTLVPSIYVSENVYCIVVGTLGLLLLVLLIADMQTFIQSITARLEEWRVRRNDAEDWMHHRQLPPELKQHVRRYDRHKWLATRGVDEKSLLAAFPAHLQRQIKRHLCLNLVRQVPVFDEMDELTLDVICERLEPALYAEETYLVREGDPVSEIHFIIRGQLDSYSTDGGRTGFFSSSRLGRGGFCGEELLMWVLDPSATDTLPSSTQTIKAVSDVETFCLRADDLKFVAAQFHTLHSRNLRHKFKFYSQQWKMWGACYIQAAWRRYKNNKTLATLIISEQNSSTVIARSGTEEIEMDIFVPRPDAGIEVYAAKLITDMRRERSKRFT